MVAGIETSIACRTRAGRPKSVTNKASVASSVANVEVDFSRGAIEQIEKEKHLAGVKLKRSESIGS